MPKAADNSFATLKDIKYLLQEFKKEFKKEFRKELKQDLKNFATKDDLRNELSKYASKDDLKTEIFSLKGYVDGGFEKFGEYIDNSFANFATNAREVFPLKEDFNSLKEEVVDMKESIQSHTSSLDGLAYQVENLRIESAAHTQAYKRLEARVKELQN